MLYDKIFETRKFNNIHKENDSITLNLDGVKFELT